MHRLAVAPRGADLVGRALLRGGEARRIENSLRRAFHPAFAFRDGYVSRLAQSREQRAVERQQTSRRLALGGEDGGVERRYRLQSLAAARRAATDAVALRAQRLPIAPRRGQGYVRFGAGTELVGREILVRRALRLGPRGQRHAHHLAQRTHVILGDPLPETHLRLGQQRTVVQPSHDGLYPRHGGRIGVQTPHDARIDVAPPELHDHGVAAPHLVAQRVGNGVTIGRLRQGHHYIGVKHRHDIKQRRRYEIFA